MDATILLGVHWVATRRKKCRLGCDKGQATMNEHDESWIRGEMRRLHVEELADFIIALCDECTSQDELQDRVLSTLEAATEDPVTTFVDALGSRWALVHTNGAPDGV